MSVYYFSGLNRENDFRKRLRNRALTTVNLLLKVEGIDNALLRRIDETTVITIQDKSVVVYDNRNQEVYVYTDTGIIPVRVNGAALNKARKSGEFLFKEGGREALVLDYADNHKKYTVVAAAFDRDGMAKLSQLRFILAMCFISGTLITFITGLIFSKGIVAPIKSIISEVKEISSQNLSGRIRVNEPKNELDELSATFNDLLTRLQESFEIQKRFIANASHELSTPLTSISSQLEVTLQNERNTEEYRSILFSVYEDVKHLNQLTRSLLEIAKASGTSDGMELALVRIDELLMKMPGELRKTDKSYIVDLHFEAFPENEDKLLIFGNNDLVYSAIKNVVLNACKFADNHTAKLVLSFTKDHLLVTVQNTGTIISEDDKKLIFQPFYRGSGPNDTSGFGLGLSLASRIIKLHKGEITVESSATEGTVFSIHFPIARMFHNV
jgi:signal transduction histidine kinase